MLALSTPLREQLTALCTEQDNRDLATPFFVYDLDALHAHVSRLTTQDVVKLWYAVKANPLSSVLNTLDKAGFNFDVASRGELTQVLSQDIAAERVLNTGPAKSPAQIQHFLDAGVTTFVAESLNQVRWLNDAAEQHQKTLTVLLRVQLRWPAGDKNPLGGDSLTPFGLGCEQWQQLTLSDYPALDFAGLHIFQWGNMLDATKLASLWQQMVPPLVSLSTQLGMSLRILDLGGGLGVPYEPGQRPLDWDQVIDSLAKIKADAGVEELWMELGRYAVAHCGYYLNPVVEQKHNYGEYQLIMAGGVNHLLRPAVTSQAFPVKALRESTAAGRDYHLHGPLCTAIDYLGTHKLPDDLDYGDWLVFGQCGAYGFTESMPYFLCHELPAEFVFKQGQLYCIRQSEHADYYLR
ncbi:diaminopimelate decarboxylase [Pseudoalteromonas rubra]|uniref:Diaminopimelate decarboxylase n=1 Tax=Pseudoalteromonas rubra TaxID=43658 RepID=A0A5S3WT69_9GAMM|nr:PLP-dependent decarboxylase [Pseudoalteromonas rubra]TMP31606.1 diaminopimelate decarboxylase [Pseudoalteromonas rubra]TMP34689.1 diaminopimelate decarboxylase [Pseudoalteromonas rubra]